MQQLDPSATVSATAEQQRGVQAAKITNDPTFQDIIRRIDEKYVAEWRTSTDPAKREAAWMKLHALEDITLELGAMIGSGELASRKLAISARRGINPRI